MSKRLIFILLASIFVITMVPEHSHAAIDVFSSCSADSASSVCKATSDKIFGAGGIWNNILNVLTYVIGGVAVLMIVIGGLRYVLSGGDPKGTQSAKDTIVYAVVGIVIAIMANAIVNFVLVNI